MGFSTEAWVMQRSHIRIPHYNILESLKWLVPTIITSPAAMNTPNGMWTSFKSMDSAREKHFLRSIFHQRNPSRMVPWEKYHHRSYSKVQPKRYAKRDEGSSWQGGEKQVLGIKQLIQRRQKPEHLSQGQRYCLCVEEINEQPDYKANKDKLKNKVKTVCISCKNTTYIKHFIRTCGRCFEGSDEWFYLLVFLHVVYSGKNSNSFWKLFTN